MAIDLTIEQVKEQHKELLANIDAKLKASQAQGLTPENPLYVQMQKDYTETKKALDNLTEQVKNMKAKGAIPGAEEEEKKFSIFNVAKALVNIKSGTPDPWSRAGAGAEKEMMDARREQVSKTATSGVGANMGFLIPATPQAEIVGLAFAKMPVMKFNVTRLQGLTGDVIINRLTSRGTGYHVGENAAPSAVTSQAVGQIIMRPREAAGYSVVTDKLLQQTSNAAEALIREQLALTIRLEMEQNGFINGTGNDYKPLGLLAAANTALYTTSTVSNTNNGARMTFDKLAQMVGDLEDANELEEANDDDPSTAGGDPKNMGFLMYPKVRQGIFRERINVVSGAASTAGFPLMVGQNILMNNRILQEQIGYPIKTTTLMPHTNSVGTSSTCADTLFANWKYFYAATWGEMQIKTSEHASDASGNSAFLQRLLMILVTQMYDCAVVRPTAFTVASGCETLQSAW